MAETKNGTTLKETGKVLMILGVVAPVGIQSVATRADGATRAVLLILTDVARLAFFIGLICFIIGRRRENA